LLTLEGSWSGEITLNPISGSMNIALITNSLAGNGRAIELSHQIQSILEKREIGSKIFKENDWGDEVYNYDQAWIVGGDGTVNYFVNQYHDIKKPLCIFNGGTGNDFYALLYGNITLENQIAKVLSTNPKPIDAGKCNEHYFLNGVGLGFEGAVAKSMMGTKKFHGKISFMLHILKHIFTYKEQAYTVKAEDKEIEHTCLMISIANGRRYGGGFYVAPLADPQDGQFEAILVQKLSVFKRLRYLPVIEKGKHLSLPFITYFQTKKIVISGTDSNIQAHLDGEYMEAKELVIEALPSHFNFVY